MIRYFLFVLALCISIPCYAGDKADTDGNLLQAIRVIKSTYGDDVSIVEKRKDLIKFGTNPAVGSSGRFTIWYTGQDQANESYVADNTNSIDSVSSNNTGDTEVVSIEGHTMSGGDRTFVVQTVTLTGQTRAALTTPLNRVTRLRHADQSSTNLVGEIYVYENTSLSSGKPSDTTKIHLTLPAGENQSQKASTSLSSQDYWIVTGFSAGYPEKTGSNITDVRLEVRRAGGVFRPVSKPIVLSTGGDAIREFNPYVIIPKNSDVKLTANSSTTGQEIVGDIQGYLAIIK